MPVMGTSASAKPPISRHFVIVGIVVGVPVSAVFLALAARGLQPHDVVDSVHRAHVGDLLLAVACLGAMYACQALRWQRIAVAAGLRLGWRSFLRMVITGIAVNNAVPGRAGDAARVYWLSRDSRGPAASALSTVIVDRAADLLVLIAAAVVSYPFMPHPAWSQHVVEAAAAAGLLVVAALAGAYMHTAHAGPGRRQLLPQLRWRWLRQRISQTVRGAASTVNRRDLPVMAALAVFAWAAFAVAAWAVGQSLDISLTLADVVFTTAVVNLGVAIPSAPGFVGSYQWLCVASLGLVGIDRQPAFAFSILLQAAWYVPTTVIGLALLVRDAGPRRRWQRELRATAEAKAAASRSG